MSSCRIGCARLMRWGWAENKQFPHYDSPQIIPLHLNERIAKWVNRGRRFKPLGPICLIRINPHLLHLDWESFYLYHLLAGK